MEMKLPNRLEVQPDVDRILMSDTLKDQVADVDPAALEELSAKYVHVVAHRVVAGQQLPITGIMLSTLFDAKPEVELKVLVDDALDVIEAQDQHFDGFELHHGERIVPLKGPFKVVAARIQEVDVKTQMCVLLLQLERMKKA